MRAPAIRKRVAVLLLVLAGAYSIHRLPVWLAGRIESGLGRALGRAVHVGSVRLRLWPFAAEVDRLTIAAPDPAAPPFLEIARVLIVPDLTPRLDGRVVLARVDLVGPVVRLNAWAAGGDDIPRLSAAGGGYELRVRRLLVEDGALHVNHERVPLTVDVPDFEGRLAARRAGIMNGSFRFAPGKVRFGEGPELPIGSDVDVELDGAMVLVKGGHLRADNTDLAYQGLVRLRGDPALDLRVNGRVDIGLVDRHVLRTGFGLEGAGHFEGGVLLNRSQLSLHGRVYGVAGRFKDVAVSRFDARMERGAYGLRVRDLDAELLGGTGRFDLDVPPAPGAARVKASLQGVDTEGLLRTVFDWGELGVAAGASGELEVSWPRGRPRLVTGRVALDLQGREAEGRTRLEGRFEWEADQGRQRVSVAELKTPVLHARLHGTLEADARAELSLDAETGSLEAADVLLVRLRRALGQPTAGSSGLAGSGSFRGHWRGSLSQPLFEGRFAGEAVTYRGVAWGRAEWAGTFDADEIHSHSLALRKDGGELWLDGRVETGAFGRNDGIDAQLRFSNWPAADLRKALEWTLPLEGRVSGAAELRGRRSALHGTARVTADTARFHGVPIRELEVRAELEGPLTQVRFGRATVGGGVVLFRGSLTDTGVYDGFAELQAVGLDDILPALGSARLGGAISGDLRVEGPLERPRLQGRFTSPRLFLGDEGLGALDLQLHGDASGDAELELSLRSPRVEVRARGSIGVAMPHEAQLHVTAADTSIDPFLRELFPALPSAAAAVIAGQLDLQGPLGRPRELRGELLIPTFTLPLPDYPVHNAEPFYVKLEDGQVRFSELRLLGEGTSLVVKGALGLGEGDNLDIEVEGDADLQALSAVTRRVRGRGAARLAVGVTGTRGAPRAQGRLEIEGAGLRIRGVPQGVDDLHGVIRFDENAALLDNVTGRFGEGELRFEGQLAYAAGGLRSFEVRALGTGLSLRYPEGLRALFDGDLRLFGDAQTQWITGVVDVKRARWTRRYDLASELLATTALREPPLPLAFGARYDLILRAPGTLSVNNNLAALDARAELRLTGSADAPVLLGRAEVDRGRVFFQGTTYVIRRGTIDFTNPQGIEPAFNIEAEARVRSYRVTLKVNGTLERVYPILLSDPPLSAVQILNLLAGADESDLLSVQASQLDTSRLAASGAATLAAGRLAEEVGLERGAEKLFGLSRFSIDPSLVRGGISDPTARVTLGKRVGRDLSMLYSVDLRGTDERLLSVEYTLSDRLSILLTQAVPGGVGLDVRLRQSR